MGSALLDAAAANGVAVTALGRRPGPARASLAWQTIDLAHIRANDIPRGTTGAVCCLGTTIATAGSQEAFRAVDHGLVLAFARACRQAGVPTLVVVSAAGADATSRIFYNRVKGEMERDVAALGFASLSFLRPGLLLGDRTERRPLERGLVRFTRAVRPILPGVLKGSEDHEMAGAILAAVQQAEPGTHILDNAAIRRHGATASRMG